jgi:hypothetical protein
MSQCPVVSSDDNKKSPRKCKKTNRRGAFFAGTSRFGASLQGPGGVILRASRGFDAVPHRRLTFVKPFGPYAEQDINASRRDVGPAESGDNVAVNA